MSLLLLVRIDKCSCLWAINLLLVIVSLVLIILLLILWLKITKLCLIIGKLSLIIVPIGFHLIHHLFTLCYKELLLSCKTYLVLTTSWFPCRCRCDSPLHCLTRSWTSSSIPIGCTTCSSYWSTSLLDEHILIWNHICGCNTMHKVWMLTIPVSISLDIGSIPLLSKEIFLPSYNRVVRLSSLQPIQYLSIVCGNLPHFYYSVSLIEGIIWVESFGIRWRLCISFFVSCAFWVFVTYKEHLSQQDPVLELNLTHTL